MEIEIAEVSATKGGAIYVAANFWWVDGARDSGARPDLSNDFLMPHLQPTVTRIVRDEKGWPVTARGQSIDPATLTPESRYVWATETVDGDVRGQIMRNVMQYAERMQGTRGDTRTPTIERVQSDPKRLLERDDVQSLQETVVRSEARE